VHANHGFYSAERCLSSGFVTPTVRHCHYGKIASGCDPHVSSPLPPIPVHLPFFTVDATPTPLRGATWQGVHVPLPWQLMAVEWQWQWISGLKPFRFVHRWNGAGIQVGPICSGAISKAHSCRQVRPSGPVTENHSVAPRPARRCRSNRRSSLISQLKS